MPDGEQIYVHACPCGIKIRYAQRHRGRTVTCKGCQRAITLGTGQHATAHEPERLPVSGQPRIVSSRPMAELPADSGRSDSVATAARHEETLGLLEPDLPRAKSVVIPASLAAKVSSDLQTDPDLKLEARRREALAKRREGGFWRDAGRAIAYARDVDSVMKTIGIALMLFLAELAGGVPILGAIAVVCANGLAWSFFFQTVANSAGGDDSLPSSDDWDGLFESGVKPFLTIIVISVVLIVPGVLFIEQLERPAIGFVLLGVGVFFWPVIILLVALGGGMMIIRFDLAIRTIISAFLPYLAVLFLLGVAFFAASLALGSAESLPAAFHPLAEHFIIWPALTSLSFVYLMVVTMKVIGLYYRHYSDRFPWNAG